jgi:hypothetical protein
VVQDYVRSCSTCQRNNTGHLHPAGLLPSLQVSSAVWTDVTMDFIEALPKVSDKSVILTMVDRFLKYAHFIPLGHPYTMTMVAHAFFVDIVRLTACRPLSSATATRHLQATSGASCSGSSVFGSTCRWLFTPVRQPIRGDEQYCDDVPALPHRRSTSALGAVTALGTILLQLVVPELPAHNAIPRRLRS